MSHVYLEASYGSDIHRNIRLFFSVLHNFDTEIGYPVRKSPMENFKKLFSFYMSLFERGRLRVVEIDGTNFLIEPGNNLDVRL